jgi:hypothetical protein
MKRISRSLLLTIAFVIVFALVWSKVQIWIRVNVTLFQALFIFGGAVFILFLLMDHFINRD